MEQVRSHLGYPKATTANARLYFRIDELESQTPVAPREMDCRAAQNQIRREAIKRSDIDAAIKLVTLAMTANRCDAKAMAVAVSRALAQHGMDARDIAPSVVAHWSPSKGPFSLRCSSDN